MKNHYVLVLSIFGLLCLNHAAQAMEERVPTTEHERSTRVGKVEPILRHMHRYRAFSNWELQTERGKLEDQLAAFMGNDFNRYEQQPDKYTFLVSELSPNMPEGMFYCVQKLAALFSVLQEKSQAQQAFGSELE